MKILILVSIIFMLTGCGKIDRITATVTGLPTKICVEGVTYLQFTSGTTVQLDINGKPVGCK